MIRSPLANAFIGAMVVLGAAAILAQAVYWETSNFQKFVCYFLMTVVASILKVKLPGVNSTMSVNFLFVLVGIVEFTPAETLVIGCSATLLQALLKAKARPTWIQIAFNIGDVAISIAVAAGLYHLALRHGWSFSDPLLVGAVALVYFFANTFPVAIIIALTENKSFRTTWRECFFWSLPYYIIGAGIAQGLHVADRYVGWKATVFVLPLVYIIFRSYRLYLGRLAGEKLHAQQLAALHLRTIEALALAIDAKDHTTSAHLRRVQVYAVEIGTELGLSEDDLHALRAAALLHDIGKLAVPEHIISKPGKLTVEEFEKMKIQPVVGAEILEEVDFPYPVVPIVRAHHEKWNGTGYPSGLKGEEIPLGARILSAVDCLDALASDRQYRRALSLDDSMAQVQAESGTSFDPRIVEILSRRYRELEEKAQRTQINKRTLSTRMKVSQHVEPAAGLEVARQGTESADPFSFLNSIAAARQEVQALFELTQDIGNSLSLSETLSVLAVRLKKIVYFDSMAIYVIKEGRLVPEFVSGDDFRLFSSLSIPVGEGLSGWVAENDKAIVNGNPSVEPGYLNDLSKVTALRSALSVPLSGLNGVLGAMTLYRAEKDAFTKDNLRVLLAVSSKISLAIENALKYRQAESCATTDFLTGLPNARSLFLHLDSELVRTQRAGGGLAVLVCDLDGFKQINDRFGHLEGNRLLQMVAASFKENCREYDYVARMGGDEFVLVIPGLTREKLEARVAQLEHAVHTAGKGVCGEPIVALSVGAALYPDDARDAEGLLAEADRKMYGAKEGHKRFGYGAPEIVPPYAPVQWVSTTVQ
jgi:diguanylate cyclase (GGDEF)-like protein/putative nucleotidyltransferase with HDIG domain